MNRLRLVSLVALAALVSCRRLRHRAPNASVGLRWYAHPSDGRSLRVEEGRFIHGALRFTDSVVAPAPWPSTNLAATARDGERWLFASDDGTVYRAGSFDGPLTVVAELPTRLMSAFVPLHHTVRGVHSQGRLFALDVHRRAYAVSFDGAVRTLPLERVITGAFMDERLVLAVTEPGTLRVSDDGGEHFRAVRVPTGVPLRVNLENGRLLVTTTGGTYRWRAEGLEIIDPQPDREAWVYAPRSARMRVRDFILRAFQLPPEAHKVAANRDGTLALVTNDGLLTIDPRARRMLRRDALPGSNCVVYSSGAGLRLACTHESWAQALFAPIAGSGGATSWATLRDEARAEPMGPVVFDDTSGAWAVSAPCAQMPERDPHRVCVYEADGSRHELRAPFAAEVVAMHDGAALAIDVQTSRAGGPTRAVLHRGAETREVTLPMSAAAARSIRWDGATLHAWELTSADPPRLTLKVGAYAAGVLAWRDVPAPADTRAGVHGPHGAEFAVGDSAAALWRSVRGSDFRPLAPPVKGHGATFTIGHETPSYCVGAWCRFGDSLSASFAPDSDRATTLARATPPEAPLAPRPRYDQRGLYCRLGASAPGPEMDHGVALTGHTFRWQVTGRNAAVFWSGETLTATATGLLSTRANGRVLGRGVPWTRSPVGLLEQCNDIACDHFIAARAGLRPLSLGRAQAGGVELFERAGGGYLVRYDETLNDTTVTTLLRVDDAGAEQGRRNFLLAEGAADAHVGRVGDDDGLWVRDVGGALHFYPIATGDYEGLPTVSVRAPDATTAGCAAGHTARGEVRIRERPAQVWGDGWFVEAGEWQQEEVLDLVGDTLCLRAIGGGEARDEAEARAAGVEEHEPVRSFELTAEGPERVVGRAWAGRTRRAVECEFRTPRSP
jgi:hypothetical protein